MDKNEKRAHKLDLEIPDGVYGYLVTWGLSNGYKVNTDEDHTILYSLTNRDPIVDLKAWKQGTMSVATYEEAESLITNLAHLKANEAIPYAPVYSPQIRVDEEMYHHHLRPALEAVNWKIEWHHEGVFWFIQRVREEDASNILCRSEVTEFIRSLEYKRRIAPFLVIREKGTQSIQWKGKQIDSLEEALAVVQREKDRHAPGGDWKVWEDVTATAEAIAVTDDIKSEAGFMIRGWFPGEVGGEYWQKEYCEELQQALLSIVRMQEFDPDAVCAVYACRYHEAPEEQKPEPDWKVIAYPAFLAQVDAIENGGICLVWNTKSPEEVCVLSANRKEDIEAADLEHLSSTLRGKLTAGADRLVLFTFFKALKIEAGIQFERYSFDDAYHGTKQVEEV